MPLGKIPRLTAFARNDMSGGSGYPHGLYLPRSGTAHRPFPTYFNGRIQTNNVGRCNNCPLLIVNFPRRPPCLSLWERWPSAARTERGNVAIPTNAARPSQSPAVTALPEGEPRGARVAWDVGMVCGTPLSNQKTAPEGGFCVVISTVRPGTGPGRSWFLGLPPPRACRRRR